MPVALSKKLLESILGFIDYSFGVREDWAEFVGLNNTAGKRFLSEDALPNEPGHILTSTSEEE